MNIKYIKVFKTATNVDMMLDWFEILCRCR